MNDWILKYLSLRMPIIPLCDAKHEFATVHHKDHCLCAGKVPLIKNWEQQKITYRQDILKWEERYKKFNIGMPLGEVSGYCGIDVDGESGEMILKAISGGDLPTTWEFSTGNGKRYLYKIPENIETKKFKIPGDGEHEECALLCTGQQTVLPPSEHTSGKLYSWHKRNNPMFIDCADAPAWLLEKITNRKTDSKEAFDFSSFYSTEINQSTMPNVIAQAEPTENFPGLTPTTINTGTSAPRTSDEATRVPQDVPFDETGAPAVAPMSSAMSDKMEEQLKRFAGMFESTAPVDTESVEPVKKKQGKKVILDFSNKMAETLDMDILQGDRDNVMTSIVGHYCAKPEYRAQGIEFLYKICQEHNLTHCKPPLDEQVIRNKVDNFFTKESLKAGARAVSNKRQFQPSQLAFQTIAYLAAQNIYLSYDNFSHSYYTCSKTKGPWKLCTDRTFIRKCIRNVLLSPEYGDTSWDNTHKISEVQAAIEEFFSDHTKPYGDFDLGEHSKELSEFIVLLNGVFFWKTGELKPWSPDYKTTLGFNIVYDAKADCPNFLKYLRDWIPSENIRKVIQEYFGYCLIPNTHFRKALFLHGGGKNGKSMLLEFFQVFFEGLHATLSYDSLFNRFGPAHLHNKLVNIYDDTTVSFTRDTSTLKNLIAGGRISAEYKGRDMFMFKNIARFIYSSQKTPKTSDTTEAWFDRWFFIHFPNKFRPSNEATSKIKNDLRAEIPGIFNWAVEGLRRLMKNDDFTRCEEVRAAAQAYRESNDNVVAFLKKLCVFILPDNYIDITSSEKANSLLDDEERSLYAVLDVIEATNVCLVTETEYKKTKRNFTKASAASYYDIYCVWCRRWQQREVGRRTFMKRFDDLGLESQATSIGGVKTKTFKYLYIDKGSEIYEEQRFEIDTILSAK